MKPSLNDQREKRLKNNNFLIYSIFYFGGYDSEIPFISDYISSDELNLISSDTNRRFLARLFRKITTSKGILGSLYTVHIFAFIQKVDDVSY
jgi:hypothetical protein